MVLHKRFDYGSSGYQVPVVPHVPKSARGKRSARKKVEENKMCAFDLLATVADQLLTEGESFLGPCSISGTPCPASGINIVKEENSTQENSIKSEILDQHSCSSCLLGSEIVLNKDVDYDIKEQLHASETLASGPASVNLEISNKDIIAEESKVIGHGGEASCSVGAISGNNGSGKQHYSSMDSHKYKGEEVKTPTRVERRVLGAVMDVNAPDLYSSEDPMDLDAKPPALVSSDSSAEVPVLMNKLPQNSSFPKPEHDLELAIDKDDDENSSGCTHPSILINKPSRVQRIGDRRIRKLLARKYWNAAPMISHETELSSYDVETKLPFHGKKMCYMRQRTHRGPFKRKKLMERCPVSDVGIYHRNVSNLCEKPGVKLEQSDPSATLHGVKLSISSFKIPEIFIEMPESATVGSLKRTIMEAVTAILGGGLRVGVLLQGKKVRDDNKTLRQAGIFQSDKLDNLGFMLEPNSTQVSAPLTTFGDPHLPTLAVSDELSTRIETIGTAPVGELGSDITPQPLLIINPESDHDSVYSPVDASPLDKLTAKSQALVVVPPVNSDAMAVVPLRKPRRSEVVQRRIRRPFSVAEVEALVQAVEKLGTGRWRDVKLRAFDNAKHRTYVDLKDKWKTLVHTARISPQQRRGEPVPQELLDRVLEAHAYWSQQQAKLHIKPPSAEACLLIKSHN